MGSRTVKSRQPRLEYISIDGAKGPEGASLSEEVHGCILGSSNKRICKDFRYFKSAIVADSVFVNG